MPRLRIKIFFICLLFVKLKKKSKADLHDKESLIQVVRGSDVVFGVTNYWEKVNADDEIQQGKNLVDAVKKTGIPHFIWSSLLNITERE